MYAACVERLACGCYERIAISQLSRRAAQVQVYGVYVAPLNVKQWYSVLGDLSRWSLADTVASVLWCTFLEIAVESRPAGFEAGAPFL